MAFDKILLHIEGVNGKLSDIDYLSAALSAVQRFSGVAKEVSGTPAWFRVNKPLMALSNLLAPSVKDATSVRDTFLDGLINLRSVFPEIRINKKGSLLSMLEAIRNSLLGKLHYPHAAMIEHGIHAVTFEAVKKKNDNKVRSLPDSLNGLI